MHLDQYQLDPNLQRIIGNRNDFTTRSHVCEICYKRYRYPKVIKQPRDAICATCEQCLRERLQVIKYMEVSFTRFSIKGRV